MFAAPKDSYLVLLNNAIFYAAKKENLIPAWWYQSTYKDRHPWHSELRYSVNGKPGGPILLWLSNNNQTTTFEMHLNASFYGIDPNGWLAIDVQRWKVVAKGMGQDIAINVTVPAESWMPIYIMNSTSNLKAEYSNLPLKAEETSRNSANYTVQGFQNQTGWLVISATRPPVNVVANTTGVLSQAETLSSLNSSATSQGWYYDPTWKLLLVRFKTASTVQIQVTQNPSAYALADIPHPMVSQDNRLNHTIVIASSTPHGPCGGAHTMDVMGATLIATKLGLYANGGTPSSAMDDQIATYDPQTGTITLLDTTHNLITVGGPGVNMVTKYYNDQRDQTGNHVLPAYFDRNSTGADYIYVNATGNAYYVEYDAQGRKTADYALIELYHDTNHGRWILIIGGLGGEGTWAAAKVLSTLENWNLNGDVVIVKYYDSDGNGLLDTITIEDRVSTSGGHLSRSNVFHPTNIGGTVFLQTEALLLTASLSAVSLIVFLSTKRRELKWKVIPIIFSILLVGAVIEPIIPVRADTQQDLSSYPHPFTSTVNTLNFTCIVASSDGHGPCGGAHTMDVSGAILVAQKISLSAEGGVPDSTMDDYAASYDFESCSLTFLDTTHNLITVGGPGVNMVTKYYNDLKDGAGDHVLPVYFGKNSTGSDYIHVDSTGNTYYVEYDAQGRKRADYAVIELYYDSDYGRWVLIIAGLGGEGTWAAAKVLSTYEDWDLTGTAAIVKYYDSNGDGYLDTIAITETIS